MTLVWGNLPRVAPSTGIGKEYRTSTIAGFLFTWWQGAETRVRRNTTLSKVRVDLSRIPMLAYFLTTVQNVVIHVHVSRPLFLSP